MAKKTLLLRNATRTYGFFASLFFVPVAGSPLSFVIDTSTRGQWSTSEKRGF